MFDFPVVPVELTRSLSARRAWIEIDSAVDSASGTLVALRKESVDRNTIMLYDTSSLMQSLSARRAWIEIGWYWRFKFFCAVALRKESVDRN